MSIWYSWEAIGWDDHPKVHPVRGAERAAGAGVQSTTLALLAARLRRVSA